MNSGPIHSPIKYYQALDGLRGYAVLMVLFYHGSLVTWGWIGVHIFFVLSGFLITRNLFLSKGRPGYYKSFFVKRITRIFPIYYLMLFASIAWSIYRDFPIGDAWMYIIFIQNFKLGYNEMITNFTDWFDHTWTLAVEEQFYLFFPFIVAGLNRRAFKITCLVLIIAGLSAIITIPFLHTSSALNVKHTISCMPFLCAGALLATANDEAVRRNRKTLLYLSAGMILALLVGINILFLPGSWDIPFTVQGRLSLVTALPVIVLLVEYLTTHGSWLTRSLFENKIIVYLGKISYGLYLYHYPVFIICLVHQVPFAATLAITFLLAVLSWHFIEKKFMGLRNQLLAKDNR